MGSFRWSLSILAILFILPLTALAQDQSDPYYKAANGLYQQKNYDLAIRYYQATLQVNPNKWEAAQGLGNCYYAKGDKANALASYEKALALNPNSPGLANFVQALRAQVPPQPVGGNNPVVLPAPARAMAAPVDRNLPKEGHIVLEIEEWDWAGSWSDVQKLTGGGSYTNTPIGIGLGLGAAYAFAPNIQAGVKLQFMLKQPEEVSYGSYQTYTFSENLVGGALEGEGVFPIGDGINFLGSLEAGFYTMVGSTLAASGVYNYTADLAASGPGGRLSAGIELLMDSNKSWALDILAHYQFLSMSPVTESLNSTSATLSNADGSTASLDFSGPGLSLGARFF